MEALITGIVAGVPLTLALTAVSFALGALLGLPLCALRTSVTPLVRGLGVLLIVALRSVPPILVIFLIYFGIGTGYLSIGPFQASVLGLGVITSANMAEIYRGSLAAIHSGQWEAARALGLPTFSRYRDVIGPQLFRVSLPSSAAYAIGLLKDSAIASTIGVAEIAFNANYLAQTTFRGLEVFTVAAFFYIIISLPIAVVSRRLDLQLRSRVAI